MPSKILVYGWYHQGNIGDDLFMEAYRHLFPHIEFCFSEIITLNQLQDVDAVFFGGGSFLLDRPNIAKDALEVLKSKKIFYLGVGIESTIHPLHTELMSRALLIATRSPDRVEKLQSINSNVRFVPDLVYSLQSQISSIPIRNDRSVLILSNISVVPHRSDPHWKHAAWSYFKSEFSQFLDWLVDNEYQPSLFSMCYASELYDDWASAEIVSHMDKRNKDYFLDDKPTSFQEVTNLFNKYSMVITQRFHGIVLSEMTRTPYVAIHHHDKLKFSQPGEGKFLSYYNSSKHSFISAFNQARMMNYQNILPIETNIFEVLVRDIIHLL